MQVVVGDPDMRDQTNSVPWEHRLLDVHRELALVDDAKQRKQVFAEANVLGAWAILFFLLVSIPFAVWLQRPMRSGIEALVPGPRPLVSLFSSMLVATVKVGFYYVGFWFGRREIQRGVRRALQKRGYAVCVGCGYDLRATSEPRCPECGDRFDPSRFAPMDGARTVATPATSTERGS